MPRDQYSIADAKNHLPRLVHKAEKGAPIELTRHGRPVAVILSRREYERLSTGKPRFGAALARFFERYPPGSEGVDAEFIDSLRDRSPGRDVRL